MGQLPTPGEFSSGKVGSPWDRHAFLQLTGNRWIRDALADLHDHLAPVSSVALDGGADHNIGTTVNSRPVRRNKGQESNVVKWRL